MKLPLTVFIIELYVLFFLSKKITKGLYGFFYQVTKNRKTTAYLYALFFAPGTYIHELSHLLMSFFLRVPFGKLEIIPRFQDGNLKLGSVAIGDVDPVRRTLVGFAPVIFGMGVIFTTLFLTFSMDDLFNYKSVLAAYVVFQVGNTMFLSKEDTKGSWKTILLIVVVILLFSFLPFEITFKTDSVFFVKLEEVIKRASLFLLIPIAIDLVIFCFLKIISSQKEREVSLE